MLLAGFVAAFIWSALVVWEFCADKQHAHPEPDPLKELDEAHKMELAEWDGLFLKATGKPVDPPVPTFDQQQALADQFQREAGQLQQQAYLQALANQRQATPQEMYQQALGSQHMIHVPGLSHIFDGLLGGQHGRH